MGHGNIGELSVAMADTEIGTTMGSLPQGVSQTSVQADFNRNLARLKLERFRSVTAQALDLDLREKLTVKSEQAAFFRFKQILFPSQTENSPHQLCLSFGQPPDGSYLEGAVDSQVDAGSRDGAGRVGVKGRYGGAGRFV